MRESALTQLNGAHHVEAHRSPAPWLEPCSRLDLNCRRVAADVGGRSRMGAASTFKGQRRRARARAGEELHVRSRQHRDEIRVVRADELQRLARHAARHRAARSRQRHPLHDGIQQPGRTRRAVRLHRRHAHGLQRAWLVRSAGARQRVQPAASRSWAREPWRLERTGCPQSPETGTGRLQC